MYDTYTTKNPTPVSDLTCCWAKTRKKKGRLLQKNWQQREDMLKAQYYWLWQEITSEEVSMVTPLHSTDESIKPRNGLHRHNSILLNSMTKIKQAKVFNTWETLTSPQKIHCNSCAYLARHSSEKYLSFWSLTDFKGIQAIGEYCLGQKGSHELYPLRSISQKHLKAAWKTVSYLQAEFIKTTAKGLEEVQFSC